MPKLTRVQVEMLHSMRLQDANATIADLQTQLAAAKRDGERLDWIERHKRPQDSWDITINRDPTIWLSSGVTSSDPADQKITLREKIDAARQKEGTSV